MSFVVANDLKFHVQRLGEGPPVVMLHGLLVGNLATWYFGAAREVSRDHHVLLYDLRGHGRSEFCETGYDTATMARDLACLTADYQSQPMTLVGHSYGALVALRFALDHPDRVGRLVLVDAPLPPSKIGEINEFLARTPEQMVDALPGPVQDMFRSGSRQSRRLLRALHRLLMQSSLVKDLQAEADIPDSELAGITAPTTLIYGQHSQCRDVGERLSRVMPNAALCTLPGGHYLHVDCADQLNRIVTEVCRG